VTHTQLYLAVGVPTIAIMIGMAINALVFQSLSARMNHIEARMVNLDTRFDLLMSKLVDIDNRLTRVEERLEHRG
jgi:hypothetical protein